MPKDFKQKDPTEQMQDSQMTRLIYSSFLIFIFTLFYFTILSLGGSVVKTNSAGEGSVPGWGAGIQHALWQKSKQNKNKTLVIL